ncbi:MAG TPA: hypothetical protein VMU29_02245 [Smithella sp.]|nr:hypothetical protein [Smithella sp.]
MNKHVYFILICLLIVSCTHKNTPVEVKDKLNFGIYTISPPKGYWYYPRKFLDKYKSSKDFSVITYWENKDDALKETYPKKKIGVFFNFFVTANTYKKIEDYYKAARGAGVTYSELPREAETLKTMANWSCKQTYHGIYGIECISLTDNAISIGIYGSNKNAVLSKLQLLHTMLDVKGI